MHFVPPFEEGKREAQLYTQHNRTENEGKALAWAERHTFAMSPKTVHTAFLYTEKNVVFTHSVIRITVHTTPHFVDSP